MLAESHPLIRRVIRFFALPYCYFKLVNWEECKATKIQVFNDLLYIFFVLKYYPDNYSKCRLWEMPKEEWVYYYGSVYDPWQRWKLRKEVFPRKYRLIYDDKNICYSICKAYELPLPKGYGVVNNSNFKSDVEIILKKHPDKELIAKPLEGRGGDGILIIYKEKEKIIVREKNQTLFLDAFNLTKTCFVQEYIEQHEELSKFSKSVNTIRIVTMLTKANDIIFLGARIRFGVGSAFVDNTSQGGIAVNININDGTLEQSAYDNKGRRYYKHPTSKIAFKGCRLPLWKEVLNVAENVQRHISYNKLIGQDIAISASGPVIIELNAEYDNVMFEQVCGPILKNARVRQEFDNYNLLINEYQKSLLKI